MTVKVSADFSGLEKFRRKVESLSGEVRLTDLMPNSFISRNSRFSSLEELLQAGGFEVASIDDLDNPSVDQFILENTKFRSWSNMCQTATAEYAKRKLGL